MQCRFLKLVPLHDFFSATEYAEEMKKPLTLAIIPARGGSKSIPRKNITLLGGKPLIYYTLKAARASKYLEDVIVSTDDEQIAEVARAYGADVPFLRPQELAEDTTPDLPVFQHALTWLQKNRGYDPDIVLNLRPTAPLRIGEDIDQVITLMRTTGCDSVRTLSKPAQNPFKMWRFNEQTANMEPFMPTEHFETLGTDVPRQLLPQNIFWQNAMVDATRPKFIFGGRMYGSDIRGYVIEAERAIDIDSPEDLRFAELILQKLRLHEV